MNTRAEIIAIGSELLNAGRVDTNSVWIGERLMELGLEPRLKTCVGDDHDALKACIANALERSALIITTGGLGPTFDDRTKEAFAETLGVPMFEDPRVRSEIDAFFQARGRAVTENNYKQALIPRGAIALHNALGTAPGIYWKDPPSHGGSRIVMLPGVPREMMTLWNNDIRPRLLEIAKDRHKTLRFVVSGVGESVLDERTRRVRERHAHLDWIILAPRTHIEFLVRSKDDAELEAARRDMEAELGMDLVCVGDGKPESIVLNMLIARGETLALAESVTGGILASRLVDAPGASQALLGGVVVYTAKAKAALLGLSMDFIADNGTVGEAVTVEMAIRVRERLGADWGLAITGNAGPTLDGSGSGKQGIGDSRLRSSALQTPCSALHTAADDGAARQGGNGQIGVCYIALSGPSGVSCQAHNIHGDRADVQFRAANWAIDMLRRSIAFPVQNP